VTKIDFPGWARLHQERIERVLGDVLPASDLEPAVLHQAMRYSVLGGGKRVRALLAYAAGELADADATRTDHVAAAVELIHAYSLIHDDLPCMDDDILRRGKPCCHIEYDEATALLAGDSLQSLAFGVLAQQGLNDAPAVQITMLADLARAAGSRGMAGGQAIDLASEGQSLSVAELELMHIHKTGALIRASITLGARCGNSLDSTAFDHLDHFGKVIGLAFQVVDDVLDADATTAALGKTAGKDALQNKSTYVTVLGLGRAKAFAGELRTEARRALKALPRKGGRLAELADFIVLRQA